MEPDKVEYRPIGHRVIGKDDYSFQRARIVRVANELAPGKLVEFDEDITWLKFRIRDEATGTNLTEPSGELEPSELADESDSWLRAFIKDLSNGKSNFHVTSGVTGEASFLHYEIRRKLLTSLMPL